VLDLKPRPATTPSRAGSTSRSSGGGRALTEPLDLELTDGIAVDTSRDIA